jgi:hypothetical protein
LWQFLFHCCCKPNRIALGEIFFTHHPAVRGLNPQCRWFQYLPCWPQRLLGLHSRIRWMGRG